MFEVRKTMSDVEKTTSDMEKIMSDIIFTPCSAALASGVYEWGI